MSSDVEDLEEDFVVQANLAEDRIVTEVSIKPEEVINGGNQENVEQCAAAGDMITEIRLRRPVDEQFDQLFAKEYDTNEEDDDDGDNSSHREDGEEEEPVELVLHSDATELDGKYRAPADSLGSNEAR